MDKPYLGRGWAFPPTFIQNRRFGGEVEMVDGRADIEQSLGILLRTSLGERVLQPDYGCNMADHLFDPMSATELGILRDRVETAILYHEPRINVERLGVTPSDGLDAMEGRVIFEIDYVVRESNSRYNFVYDFYLKESPRPL